jgi:hypothetical protein
LDDGAGLDEKAGERDGLGEKAAAVAAEVSLAGPATVVEGENAAYTVSIRNAKDLLTAEIVIEVDGKYLQLIPEETTGLNGLDILGGVTWRRKAGSDTLNEGRIVLTGGAVSFAESADVLKLVFRAQPEQYGASTVKITSVKLAGKGEGKEAALLDVNIGEASVETEVERFFNRYDTNRDGAVTILDLARAQLYLHCERTDADWEQFGKYCDVSGDGLVDVADLVLILANTPW